MEEEKRKEIVVDGLLLELTGNEKREVDEVQ
jgi:hypothetical protein